MRQLEQNPITIPEPHNNPAPAPAQDPSEFPPDVQMNSNSGAKNPNNRGIPKDNEGNLKGEDEIREIEDEETPTFVPSSLPEELPGKDNQGGTAKKLE